LELGEMLDRLMKLRNWSADRLATELAVSSERLRRPLILARLPDEVRELVRQGELLTSHAIEIGSALPERQLHIAKYVVKERISVEETADEVDRYLALAGDPRDRRRPVTFSWPGVCDVSINPKADLSKVRTALYEMLTMLDSLQHPSARPAARRDPLNSLRDSHRNRSRT
jgi:hypothetical protein